MSFFLVVGIAVCIHWVWAAINRLIAETRIRKESVKRGN